MEKRSPEHLTLLVYSLEGLDRKWGILMKKVMASVYSGSDDIEPLEATGRQIERGIKPRDFPSPVSV